MIIIYFKIAYSFSKQCVKPKDKTDRQVYFTIGRLSDGRNFWWKSTLSRQKKP